MVDEPVDTSAFPADIASRAFALVPLVQENILLHGFPMLEEKRASDPFVESVRVVGMSNRFVH